MKYRYKILWFEDNHETLKERYQKPLEKYLDSLGFELEIDWQPTKPATTFPYAAYDIIITDLNFEDNGGKTAGIEIIGQVRDYHILTDVLLYSSSPDRLNKAINSLDAPVERVSFNAGNHNMQEKIEKLINLTVRKVQNTENVRGLVIAETIDIETRIKDIAHQYFSRTDADRRASKVARADSCKKLKIGFFQKNLKRASSLNTERIDVFCQDNCLTAFDHLQLLLGSLTDAIKHHNRACGSEKESGPREAHRKAAAQLAVVLEQLSGVNEEILSARNTLAHVKEEKTKDGRIVFKAKASNGKEFVLNEAWCVKQRNNFRKHSRNLSLISTLL